MPHDIEKIRKERIGMKKLMSCGQIGEIIRYEKAIDIDVQFEDGYVAKNRTFQCFCKGTIRNNDYEKYKKIGEISINSQGLKMKIVEYNINYNIKVLFEDGYTKWCSYDNFIKGNVFHGNYKMVTNLGINVVGELKDNKRGYQMKIINYENSNDILIEFQDKHKSIVHSSYYNFSNGEVRNPYEKNKFGGMLGNTLSCDINGKIKKSYNAWSGMLERCFDSEETYEKLPSYKDCFVCDEWLYFENFEKWYNDNYYEIEGERMELDKDILFPKNKEYSPKYCIFVPKNINLLFQSKRKNKTGVEGVSYCKENKFIVGYINKNSRKTSKIFTNLNSAYDFYKKTKTLRVLNMAELYKNKIPQILYERLRSYDLEDYR